MSSTNDSLPVDPRDAAPLPLADDVLPPADPVAVLAEIAEVEYDVEQGNAQARPTLAAAAGMAAELYEGTPDHHAVTHNAAVRPEPIEIPVVGTREPLPPHLSDDPVLPLPPADPTQVLAVVAEQVYDQTNEPVDLTPLVTPHTVAAASSLMVHDGAVSAVEAAPRVKRHAAPQAFRPLRLLPRLAPFEPAAGRWGGWLLASVLAVLYFGLLLAYWAPAHPGVDQNGYLVGGRFLATSGSTGFTPADPFGFVGNMYVMSNHGGVIQDFPKYPIGLSLLYASFLWAFGTQTGSVGYVYAFLVSPIGAALGVFGVFATVRLFASNFAAICAMLLLGFSQVVLTLADNPNSHAACLGFVVWGGLFLIRFWQTGSIWRGLGAGFLLGFAVTIRYTEGLLGLLIAWTAMTMWDWRARGGVIGAALALAGVFVIAKRAETNLPPWLVWASALGALVAGGALMVIWLGRFDYRMLARRARIGWVARLATFVIAGGAAWALFYAYARHAVTTPHWVAFTGASVAFGLVAVGALVAPLFERHVWANFLRGWAPTLGWAVPVGYLVGFNKIAMGTWTGYDTTNESTGFTLEDFYANWERALRQIHDTGMFFVLPLGLLGMILMYRRSARLATMLWLWFLPGTLLYAAYYWAPERGVAYLRFFMTLFPPVVLGAGYLLYAASEHLVGVKRAVIETGGRTNRAAIAEALGSSSTVVAQEYPVRGSGTMLLARVAMIAVASLAGMTLLHYLQGSARLNFTEALPLVGGLALVATLGAVYFTRRERDTAIVAALPWTDFRADFGRSAVGALAAGAVVASSAGIGLYRGLLGLEDGNRSGMSIETAHRSNANLARVGQLAVSNMPAGSVLFAHTNELHYLQFMGDYACYGSDDFSSRFAQRLGNSWMKGPTPEDPNPIQGLRREYLAGVYANKSDRDLIAEQNRIMDQAFAAGRKVFLVLDKGSVEPFKTRFLKSAKYRTKVVDQCRDVVRILTDEERAELTAPEKDRGNRRWAMGGRAPAPPAAAWNDEGKIWQVVEITPAPPSTNPTTVPAEPLPRRGKTA